MAPGQQNAARLLDQLAISQTIIRERRARDEGSFADMISYYHPDAEIETSWFTGSGKDFVAQSEKQAVARKNQGSQAAVGFHQIGAIVVDFNGNRAIAEVDCTMHNFYPLEGISCKYTGYVRLLCRLLQVDGVWLISGAHCIYIRDLVQTCNPNQIAMLDEVELSTYRTSYANLCYQMVRAGLKPQNDLPGQDLPETVAALKTQDRDWLKQD